jgi:hypothetical protein
MSDCLFDLLVPATRVRAWATKPGAETNLMAEEIMMSFTQRNVCDAFDYACADLEPSSYLPNSTPQGTLFEKQIMTRPLQFYFPDIPRGADEYSLLRFRMMYYPPSV